MPADLLPWAIALAACLMAARWHGSLIAARARAAERDSLACWLDELARTVPATAGDAMRVATEHMARERDAACAVAREAHARLAACREAGHAVGARARMDERTARVALETLGRVIRERDRIREERDAKQEALARCAEAVGAPDPTMHWGVMLWVEEHVRQADALRAEVERARTIPARLRGMTIEGRRTYIGGCERCAARAESILAGEEDA